jgi:hypothetical protein
MTSHEKTLDYLEKHIPDLAGAAITQAYWHTLAAGLSVLESENGVIYEVFPDGTRNVVKNIEPPTKVPVGRVYTIR